MRALLSKMVTLLLVAIAIWAGYWLWHYYMLSPWTRDARVGADVVIVAPDVSGWVVKLNKDLFVGKEALARIKEAGLTRKMVGFEMTGRGIARHGYPIVDASGQPVGICTSGSPSPSTGKNIGLGYVPVGMSDVGTQIQVDCRGRVVPAVIVKTPFYKRAAAG